MMKAWKKLTVLALALALALQMFAVPALADSDKKPTKITAVGSKKVTVSKGSEFELSVRTTPLNADDDALTWSIVSGKKVVRFADDDRHDDEIELKALKTGTAKVRCRIRGTNKKVTFTITVKNTGKKLTAVGKTSRTVSRGSEFELEVNRSGGIKESQLRWSIADTSIVDFEEDDKDDLYDDEIDFIAKKAGKTKITCKDKKSGKKVVFTITVK